MHELTVKPTKYKGRGVFSLGNIKADQIVEVCEIILLSAQEREIINKTNLFNYYFSWGYDLDMAAIALGNGSIYNHSYKPNAKYVKDMDKQKLVIVAIKDIKPGEEITVNYNGDPNSKGELWFKVK